MRQRNLCRTHASVVRTSQSRAHDCGARPESCRCALKPYRANSVATRLCHVATRRPCQDPNSVATWEPPSLSKSVESEFPCRTHSSVVSASQSCAPSSVMGDRAPLSWPALSRLGSPLSRHNFSLFWPTLSRHRIALS